VLTRIMLLTATGRHLSSGRRWHRYGRRFHWIRVCFHGIASPAPSVLRPGHRAKAAIVASCTNSSAAAGELVEPASVASRGAGSRHVFTIEVDDVDAMCAELTKRGVELLNGPMDRPWGVRTASFSDPGGHIWEIAK
jgi:catechol 2,3-dioxygenase-like lactoylglutathione lyase family enzyme